MHKVLYLREIYAYLWYNIMRMINVEEINKFVNFPQFLYIYTNKHPVVLSQRVFFYDSFNACTILLTLSI